ncbi:hypothetical protein OV090_42760 [Nannocystis sp. RBIL2]|uniref:hypothetical protein n=1 Tax=Nannocystis sp. RBIL2 TaxID=2996788 RepID=UPI0022721027|nr:hypothetical protein [Nannocystis sp. RBIL2]MCY1071542.1 hypothetical protein [Nannocystis sp. RBIL2]
MKTAGEIHELVLHAERALLRLPGVTGVGFGWKETGGEVTESAALRVYVRRKVPRCELRRVEIIPERLAGLATDVLQARIGVPTVDLESAPRHALTSGLAITNLKEWVDRPSSGPEGAGLGTLGCFASARGPDGRTTPVLVSNRHVLLAHGARRGDFVYQPQYTRRGGLCVFHADSLDPVAAIADEGCADNYTYGYPGEAAQAYFIDCATARLLTEHGVHATPELPPPGAHGVTTVKGIARVHPLDVIDGRSPRVYKFGQASGITVGRVVDVAAPIATARGEQRLRNLIIRDDRPAARRTGNFVAAGDSGALIVNERGAAVGLLWGMGQGPASEAYACHIHPLLDRLDVTLLKREPSWRRAAAPRSGPHLSAKDKPRGAS